MLRRPVQAVPDMSRISLFQSIETSRRGNIGGARVTTTTGELNYKTARAREKGCLRASAILVRSAQPSGIAGLVQSGIFAIATLT